MSKNVIIGILAVVLIIGGGYYFSQNSEEKDIASVTEDKTPGSKTPPDTVPPLTVGPPIVQTGQNFTASNSTVLLNGQVDPNGVSTKYWFDYGENTSMTSSTPQQNVGSGFSVISAPAYITGLRANTTYYYRLSAQNNFSTVSGATYNFRTNTNPPPQGVAPTTRTLEATAVSRTTANVNGSVDPNGSETNYWFEYGKNTDLGNVTAIQGAGAADTSSAVSMSLSGLEPLTKYHFRLNAQNQYGTINGAIRNFTTDGPAAPSAPAVTTTSASSITSSGARLNGRINPNGLQTDYWFEYSQDSLLGSLIGSGTSVQTLNSGNNNVDVNQAISSLNPDTRYYYRLVGRNSEGTERGSITSFKTREN